MQVDGGPGADTAYGGGGADELLGDHSAVFSGVPSIGGDQLYGQAGADLLNGSNAADRLPALTPL